MLTKNKEEKEIVEIEKMLEKKLSQMSKNKLFQNEATELSDTSRTSSRTRRPANNQGDGSSEKANFQAKKLRRIEVRRLS